MNREAPGLIGSVPPDCHALIFRRFDPKGWPAWLRWIGRLLAPGYGHVAVLWWCPRGNAWCYLDWTASGLEAVALDPVMSWEHLLDLFAADATEVWIVRRAMPETLRLRPLASCVTIVAALLRLPRTPLTPWQLRRIIDAEGHRLWRRGEGGHAAHQGRQAGEGREGDAGAQGGHAALGLRRAGAIEEAGRRDRAGRGRHEQAAEQGKGVSHAKGAEAEP